MMDARELTGKLEELGLEVVIGLETHIRLNTATKLFCACPNEESELPNHHICPVCTGQMGVLPAVNSEAIRKTIYFGKAVRSSMTNHIVWWDRKHYEYPDLPKNFQLTQFSKPLIPDGKVECYRNDGSTFAVELEQVHIEEDAAKLVHERTHTLVDFNKAGVPLIEVVTRPCIHRIEDASVYAQYLQRIVQNLKISEANLEKGEFKSDVSVSLRRKGTGDLNPRAEIKNLNSFRFMVEAIMEEVTKQLDHYITHNDFRPDQTTVLFDAELKETKTMRKKEFAADYRFAREPDIPPVNIKSAVEEIRVDAGLLPFPVETILIGGGVLPQDAKFFTSDTMRSRIFVELNDALEDPLFVARTLTNNLKPEEYPRITDLDLFKDLFRRFRNDEVPAVLFQHAIRQLLDDPGFDYIAYFAEHVIPEEKIEASISEVISENAEIAQDIRSGQLQKTGILVGQVLKKVGKGASGKLIREKLLSKLKVNGSQGSNGSATVAPGTNGGSNGSALHKDSPGANGSPGAN